MGGAFLFIGFTISMTDLVVVCFPSTMLDTEYTCDDDASKANDGSNEAQAGREEKFRTFLENAFDAIVMFYVVSISVLSSLTLPTGDSAKSTFWAYRLHLEVPYCTRARVNKSLYYR
jgi:hypothetical protein